ncbi:MAG: mandelate racemase/muconate lactonizing enzyme family protein [Burkholderiales bacterium]
MAKASDKSRAERNRALIVSRVEAIPVAIPLKKPVLMGGGQKIEHSESLIVRIESTDGLVGWGEASTAPLMTGDTLPAMVEAVEKHLAPRLTGRNALDRAQLCRSLQEAMIGNTGAKAACDIALHDLAGKHLGVAVVDLLGGKARDKLLALAQLGNPDVEEDIAEARAKRRDGYAFFKLKVGVKAVEQEIEAAHALRKALGPDIALCADANMGMTVANARRVVAGAADAGLLFLEQPFRDTALAHTLALARVSAIPLCADESAHGVESIMDWQRSGAIAGVNLKTIKLGGIAPLMRAAVVSDTLGLAVNLAAKTGESSIGVAALVHLGYAVPNLEWGININNHYLETDLVAAPLSQSDSSVECPQRPGLGVEVDESVVRRFQVRR